MEELSKEKLALARLADDTITKHQRHIAVMKDVTGGDLQDDLESLQKIANLAMDDRELDLAQKCISKKVDAKLKIFDALNKQDDPKVEVNVNTATNNKPSGPTFDLEDVTYE